MSNARDKANIPALNFSSTGIDDNATSTAITIDSSERVGLQYATPSNFNASAQDLIIGGGSGSKGFTIYSGASNNGSIYFADGVSGAEQYRGYIAYAHGDNSLRIGTSSSEKMRLTSTGLGIGTSSPGVKLEVRDDTNASDTLRLSSQLQTSGNYHDFVLGIQDSYGVGLRRTLTQSSPSAVNPRLDLFVQNTNTYERTDRGVKMSILGNGNVGIGTTSPTTKLESTGTILASVDGTGLKSVGANAQIHADASSGYGALIADGASGNDSHIFFQTAGTDKARLTANNSGSFIFGAGGATERMRITSAGLVGIGTSSPSEKLDVSGSINLTDNLKIDGSINFEATASSPSSESIYKPAAYSIAVNTNSAEMARFVDSRLLINSTANVSSEYLLIKNNYTRSGMTIKSNTTAPHHAIEFHNPNNQVGSINTSGSSVVYNTSSDYRLKENVSYDFDATTRLKQLKPARFNFIADADTTVDGFIAHEVSSVVPEAISGEKDAVDEDGNPKYQGIDQSKLVPLLVKTIQELEARITALETNQP